MRLCSILCLLMMAILLSGCMSNNPPLVVLIKEERYDELEKCLKSGADPDKVHRQYSKQTPIEYARDRKDLRAFDLLVKHGAKIPRWMKFTSPSYTTLEFACYAFENDLHKETKSSEDGYVVYEWCDRTLGGIEKRGNADKLEVILVKLLKAGYSFESGKGYHPEPPTALDLVLLAPNLSQDVKDRLEKAFREAGAETYPEIVAKHPWLPHLDLRGRNVDPVFAKFLHVLQCAECPEGILVTTELPGLPPDVPVLVVDFKSAKEVSGTSGWTWWTLGEATKTVQWTEKAETKTREVPVGARIIVVPDHVEIPSQVGDVPIRILREVRYKVPGFNILLLEHNRWSHPAAASIITRFRLVGTEELRSINGKRPKADE